MEAAATCLDAQTLVEDVQSWIGTDTVDSDVVVDVRGSPEQPRVVGFRLLRGGRVTAVRRFEPGPARCEQLHAVLGLAIAMASKASLMEDIAPTVPPATPAPYVLPPTAPPGALPSWAIAANAVIGLAVLPDAAFGADARIERALTSTFGARLGLLAILAQGETFAAPGHFDAWLLAPRLDLCAGLELPSRLHAHGCIGISVGGLHAQGYSYPETRSTFIRWPRGSPTSLESPWGLAAAGRSTSTPA